MYFYRPILIVNTDATLRFIIHGQFIWKVKACFYHPWLLKCPPTGTPTPLAGILLNGYLRERQQTPLYENIPNHSPLLQHRQWCLQQWKKDTQLYTHWFTIADILVKVIVSRPPPSRWSILLTFWRLLNHLWQKFCYRLRTFVSSLPICQQKHEKV